MLASLLIKHWQIDVMILLFAVSFGSLSGCNHEHRLLLKEQAAHEQDISNFKNAQATADAVAQTTKVILQKESKANAEQADAKYASLLTEYRASLLRYKANQGGGVQADHHQLPAAESSDGSSSSTEVSITIDDAQICAVNTARLQAVHDWAVTLPKEDSQ